MHELLLAILLHDLTARFCIALTYHAPVSAYVHIVDKWLSVNFMLMSQLMFTWLSIDWVLIWGHAIVKRWPFMLLSSTSISLVTVPSDTNALWLAYELVLAATLPFDWHLLRQVEPSNFEILVHLHFGHFLLGLLVYRYMITIPIGAECKSNQNTSSFVIALKGRVLYLAHHYGSIIGHGAHSGVAWSPIFSISMFGHDAHSVACSPGIPYGCPLQCLGTTHILLRVVWCRFEHNAHSVAHAQ